MNMSPHERYSRSGQRRANPVAVLGALGLVAIAIAFGALGPQISDRGSMVLGVALDGVLQDAARTYEHNRENVFFGIKGDAPTPAAIDHALARKFMGQATYQDFRVEGFDPVWLDSKVQLEGLDAEGVAVTYVGADTDSGDLSIVVLLYAEDAYPLVTQDAFGTPVSMARGHVYIRTTETTRGFVVWSASWHDGVMLHVVMAPTVEILDSLIRTLGVPDVVEASGGEIASSSWSSKFDQGHDHVTLGSV